MLIRFFSIRFYKLIKSEGVVSVGESKSIPPRLLLCISLTSACNVLFWPATQEWEISKLDMECNEKQTEILNIAAMNFYVMMMTQNYFWIVF